MNQGIINEETNHLRKTIERIEDYIASFKTTQTGGYEWTEIVLADFSARRLEMYRKSKKDPYFLRTDVIDIKKVQEKIYFGYESLDLGEYSVISWKAPLGRLISATKAGNTPVVTPDGPIVLSLILKRRFVIQNGNLIDFNDEIKRGLFNFLKSNEDFLINSLYSRGDTKLQDIVKTIQSEQDELIRFSSDATLIIKGVAGSGKSSIVIHRLSVLLYPDSRLNIKPQSTIVFCPNKLFLQYMNDLLPMLGDKDVEQTTFSDWAIKQIGFKDRKYKDTAVEIFIDPNVDTTIKRIRWNRAKFKNQLRFIQVLASYRDFLKKEFSIPEGGFKLLAIGPENLDFFFTKEEILDIIKRASVNELSYDEFRESILTGLLSLFDQKYDIASWSVINKLNTELENDLEYCDEQTIDEKKNPLNSKAENKRRFLFEFPQIKTRTLNAIKVELQKKVQSVWREINIYADYYRLISNFDLLCQCNNGNFSNKELKIILSDIPDYGLIETEDIPALLIFYQFIKGKINRKYDHIVVDEGQDFSLLQYEIIKSISSNQSITISGDILQGVNSHRGIDRWDELKEIFTDESKLAWKDINICYRSTKQITDFANHIIKKTKKTLAVFPQPFIRKGDIPRVIRIKNPENLYENIFREIEYLVREKKIKNIAVITKSFVEFVDLHKYLAEKFEINYSVKDIIDEKKYIGGIIILPSYMVKGLEFEAVIISNANEKCYSEEIQYDGRLLYVAVTRALHRLSVFYIGDPSYYISGSQNLVMNLSA